MAKCVVHRVGSQASYFRPTLCLQADNGLSRKCEPHLRKRKARLDYQLIYQIKRVGVKPTLFIWWTNRDSNPGPTGYEPVALTN